MMGGVDELGQHKRGAAPCPPLLFIELQLLQLLRLHMKCEHCLEQSACKCSLPINANSSKLTFTGQSIFISTFFIASLRTVQWKIK